MMENRATPGDAATRHRTGTAALTNRKTGWDTTGWDTTGRDKTGQDNTGQDNTGQDNMGKAATARGLAGGVVLMTGLLLAGCSPNPAGSGASRLRTYAVDLAGGAKTCEVPLVKPVAGQTSDAAIKLANDGGWCALGVQQDGSKPFGAGLLMTRPSHGTVVIHAVGDGTRIDYTPDKGFAGTDAFAVKLIPGNATVRVDVTVTARQS